MIRRAFSWIRSHIECGIALLRWPRMSPGMPEEEYENRLLLYHEAWGYAFWFPVILVLFLVPELTAAFGAGLWHLPTFSTTVGHLEYVWKGTGLFVVAVMVFTAVNAVRRHRQAREPGTGGAGARVGGATGGGHYRSDALGGGRIVGRRAADYDERDREARPLYYLPAGAAVILLGGYLANQFGDHWTLAYAVWSLIAVFAIVLPSALAFGWAWMVPFPTLFRVVANLERRFHMVGTVVVAFLVALSFHLTLYPWPNVAHVLQSAQTVTLTVTNPPGSSQITVTGKAEYCLRPRNVIVDLTPSSGGPTQSQTVAVDDETHAFAAHFSGTESDVKAITAYCGATKLGSSP